MNEQIKEASHKILDVLGIPRAGYKIDLVTVELTALLEAERVRIGGIVNARLVPDGASNIWDEYSPHDINSRLEDIIEEIIKESTQ